MSPQNRNSPESPSRPLYFVLGMHRSGTSAVASLLAKAGIPWGKPLLPPAEDNPEGYWEQTEVVGLNEQMLHSLGLAWDTPQPLPRDWHKTLCEKGFSAKLQEALSSLFPDQPPIAGIKDPRLCRLYPIWAKASKKQGWTPVPLPVIRHPEATANSLKKRNGLALESGLWLWYYYNRDLWENFGSDNALPIDFDKLLANPKAILGDLSKRLPLPENVLSQWNEPAFLESALQTKLRHNRSPEESTSEPATILTELYHDLLAGKPEAFTLHQAAITQHLKESPPRKNTYLRKKADDNHSPENLYESLMGLALHLSAENPEQAKLNEILVAAGTWSEATFQIPFPIPPEGMTARLSLYTPLATIQIQTIVLETNHSQDLERRFLDPETINPQGQNQRLSQNEFLLLSPEDGLALTLPGSPRISPQSQLILRAKIDTDPKTIQKHLAITIQKTRNLVDQVAHAKEEIRNALAQKEELEELLADSNTFSPSTGNAFVLSQRRLNEHLCQDFRKTYLKSPFWQGPFSRFTKLHPRLAELSLGLGQNSLRKGLDYILRNNLFDFPYYTEKNAEAIPPETNPLLHYLTKGWRESRDPSPEFSVSWYLSRYPDIVNHDIEPFLHYWLWGCKEGRITRPTQSPNTQNRLASIHHKKTNPRYRDKDRLAPKQKILFVIGEDFPQGQVFRINRMANALPRDFYESDILPVEKVDQTNLKPTQYDVLWLWRCRWTKPLGQWILLARALGIPVVYDIDDLMFLPELANPEKIDALRTGGLNPDKVSDHFKDIQKTLREAQSVSAPTRPLLTQMRVYGNPGHLIPNSFSPECLVKARQARHQEKPEDGLIRIGYAGGTRTHQRDFAIIIPALIKILAEHPQTRLVVFPNALLMDEFPELVPFADRIEHRQMVPIENLLSEYARFSINLAPLETDNLFCEAKSELKFFEAALVEVPTIASPTTPYQQAIHSGENGFLAKDPEEWFDKLRQLVTDVNLRRNMGERAHRSVLWAFGPYRRQILLRQTLTTLTGSSFHRSQIFIPHIKEQLPTSCPCPQEPATSPVRTLFSSKRHLNSRVTVVLPLYNYRQFVIEALESVKAQTLTDLDLILVDDCSTDDPVPVVSSWLEENQSRFGATKFLQNTRNQKVGITRNNGFDHAETEFIFPLDPDNTLLPECLEKCLQGIENSGSAMAYTGIEFFGDDQAQIENVDWNPHFLATRNFIDAMALIRKDVWVALGGYASAQELLGWEDFDFWCRLAEAGLPGHRIPKLLCRYRVHHKSMLRTVHKDEEFLRILYEKIEEHHPWVDLSIPKRDLGKS
ncbi:MAG: glycosyltransferase [Opitutales bacterium]|nr:glycosyltransferase [Opitutales bacterium]